MRATVVLATLFLASLPVSYCRSADAPRTGPCSGVAPALKEKAIAVLQTAMKESKDFEKVHAAEALIWTGHAEGVKEYYLDEDRTSSAKPRYRVGIWRTLYRLHAGKPGEQQEYLKRIVAVFSDPKAIDHNTAAETLGKLKYADRTQRVLELAKPNGGELAVSARWILANSGQADDEARLAECLGWKDPKDRAYAAYALRYLKAIRSATLKALEQLAAAEPADGRGSVLRAGRDLHASSCRGKNGRSTRASESRGRRQHGSAIRRLHGHGQWANRRYGPDAR